MLDGWHRSVGVTAEINFARGLGLPIAFKEFVVKVGCTSGAIAQRATAASAPSSSDGSTGGQARIGRSRRYRQRSNGPP